MYIWTFYEYPEQRWWGLELPDLRWSLTAAVITFAAVILHRSTGNPDSGDKAREGARPSVMSFGFAMLATILAGLWSLMSGTVVVMALEASRIIP